MLIIFNLIKKYIILILKINLNKELIIIGSKNKNKMNKELRFKFNKEIKQNNKLINKLNNKININIK